MRKFCKKRSIRSTVTGNEKVICKNCNKKPYSIKGAYTMNRSAENKYKYKLHYIYREFQIDFFKMDLNSLPKNASSLKFSKFDQNVMGLCLSYKVNLGLSLRKTAHALHEIHGIKISHQQVIKLYLNMYNKY